MSIPGSAESLLLAQQDTGYKVERSLRFNSSDSAYLSRTPASAGNRKTWTWAGWVKRAKLGATQTFFMSAQDESNVTRIRFESDDTLRVHHYVGNSLVGYRQTTQVFRDASAWYHIVWVVDTTAGTGADRIKLFVNGSQITAFASTTDPSQNADLFINSTNQHKISSELVANYLDGYLADVHFIDGQALTPSSFTEVSATTGRLEPKQYAGSFGTNGFWLKFSDNSAATATTLGKDYSGNGNNWTPNNLSVTAGAGNDSLVDTPTSYGTDTGAGNEVRGNYCTLNPLNNGGVTLTNGNLDWQRTAGGSTAVAYSTIAVSSGKWYFETTLNGATSGVNWEFGVAGVGTSNTIRPGTTANGWGLVSSSNTTLYKQNNNSLTTIFTGTLSNGDIIGVAIDLDNGRIWFARNNTWLEGSPSAGTGASYTNLSGTVAVFAGGDGSAVNGSFNAGARPFAYTAPSGFKALCDTNLPAPVVAKPNTVMDVKLITANNSTQVITGLAFSPDLVWTKSRSNAFSHYLYDTVRGVQKPLISNATNAEATITTSLTSFNSDGFTLGADDGANYSSGSGVAWAWDAGSSTVTNTQGSITSQVRANASAGFSVVTYTATTGTHTIGHGLNAPPSLIINKCRSNPENWYVYHSSLGSGSFLILNSTAASSSIVGWGGNPTSSVFYNSTNSFLTNTFTYVAYCFAPVAGYSSFGSYTGNGSADGPFVYTGFRPRWIMWKDTVSSSAGWAIYDSARNSYNVASLGLAPNLSNAESDYGSTYHIDLLSNGFKIRGAGNGLNSSGYTMIYAAFAENPFQYARAR